MEGGIGGFLRDFDGGEGDEDEAMDQDTEMMDDDDDPALYEDAPDDTS